MKSCYTFDREFGRVVCRESVRSSELFAGPFDPLNTQTPESPNVCEDSQDKRSYNFTQHRNSEMSLECISLSFCVRLVHPSESSDDMWCSMFSEVLHAALLAISGDSVMNLSVKKTSASSLSYLLHSISTNSGNAEYIFHTNT